MSDQDFFFDEEDEKPARPQKASPSKTSAGKTPATRPAAPKAASSEASAASVGGFFERELSMGIASLLVVIALLLGVLVGVLVGESRANSALLSAPAAVDTNAGGGSAPALSQDQLNSGQLPAGHPSISSTNSADATGGK